MAGATGPAGATGATGPQGVITSVFGVGCGSGCTPSNIIGALANTYYFLGATATVTLAPTNKALVWTHATMGCSTTSTGLNSAVCYGTSPYTIGNPLTVIGGAGAYAFVQCPVGSVLTYPSNAYVTALTGTYVFGFCGSTPTPANWNIGDYGRTLVTVVN